MFRLISICLLVPSLLAACLTANYPTSWPRPERVKDGCPDISGSYYGAGQSAYNLQNGNGDSRVRLSTFFFESERGSNATMKFVMTDGKSIRIQQIEGGDVLQARELIFGEHYSCSEGRVWLPDGGLIGGGAFPVFVVGVESRKVGFVRTNDGSLLGEVLAKGVAVAIVVPFGGSEHDYLLWSAVEID